MTSDFSNIPAELRNRNTWLLHRCKADPKKPGKVQRIPHGADGKPTNTNPEKFLTFEDACEAVPRFDGLTLALTGDGLACVDLDNCRNPETGALTPAAQEILDMFGDSYAEVSGSGRGIHIWCFGRVPKNSHPDKSWVEIYDHAKAIAMTGNPESWVRSNILDCQAALTALFQRCEAGEFTPSKKETLQASTGDLSMDDWKLAWNLALENHCDEGATLKAFLQQSKNDRKKLARRDYAPNTVKKVIDIIKATKGGSPAAPSVTVVETPSDEPLTDGDMPAECLDGWLGQVCRERMAEFPRGLAWPALLGAGSVFVPHESDARCGLFVDLDAPIHAGKSTGWAKAFHLLSLKKNVLPRLDAKCGSVEGMAALLEQKAVNGQSVIIFPDELAHLLQKAAIEHAAFPEVLQDAFYVDQQELTVANRKQITLNARISVLGGTVTDRFGDLFGASTMQGLYDRFLFGTCPEGFQLAWRPFESEAPAFVPSDPMSNGNLLDERPVAVKVDHRVWDELNRWKDDHNMGRVAEIALRCAVIAASFDGRSTLTVDMLGPAFALAQYQMRLRTVLQPNPGLNPDAQMAFKIKRWLHENANDGRWINRRLLSREIHAERLGPSVFDRTISSLVKGGELDVMDFQLPGDKRKTPCVRLVVHQTSPNQRCYLVTNTEVANAN